MVRTRSSSCFVSRQNVDQDINDFRAELIREYERIRWKRSQKMVQKTLKSPRKMYKKNQDAMAKKQLKEMNGKLEKAKKNLSKAEDRILPDQPVQQLTVIEEIHEQIRNGEAKRNLRPLVIVID